MRSCCSGEAVSPDRLAIEPDVPDFGAGEDLPDLPGQIVDAVITDQRAVAARMPAARRYHARDVVAGDVGDQHVLAKKLDQISDLALGIAGGCCPTSDQ
jgi:hypothetical protein